MVSATLLKITVLLTVCCCAVFSYGKGKIAVHIIAHSHDDVGWLKTPVQYFNGWNNSAHHANVRLIYDSVFQSLLNNPDYIFTAVEMSFFSWWYNEQTETRKQQVKQLVATGQLYFANGGWCSHDEATTYYIDTIDQMTLGHNFLKKEFGVVPSVNWQVDPFGHTTSQASLFSEVAGFNVTFHSRIDYQEFSWRQRRQTREHLWAPSPSLGRKGAIFASMMLHSTYCPPEQLNFDILIPSPPTVVADCYSDATQDPNCVGMQTDWVKYLLALIQSDWKVTAGKDIMLTMGCDFNYMQAENYFLNIKRMIRLVTDADPKIDMFFSTPARYFEAKSRTNVKWNVKTSDFLPYSDNPHAVWSGFYSSRPTFKRFVRIASSYFTSLRQIASWASAKLPKGHRIYQFTSLWEALGQSQHHDAITGTAKQHVSFAYTETISSALVDSALLLADLLRSTQAIEGNITFCTLLNVSERCGSTFLVWNPDTKQRNHLLRFPVATSKATAQCRSTSRKCAAATFASSPCGDYEFFKGSALAQPFTIAVLAELPPLSFSVVEILERSEIKEDDPKPSDAMPTPDRPKTFQNDAVRITFGDNGLLAQIENKKEQIVLDVVQSLCYYESSTGDENSPQQSGAYIFRPKSPKCIPVATGDVQLTVVEQGPNPVIVVEQGIAKWARQRFYIYDGNPQVEIEYTIGPLPLQDGIGKEVVMNFLASEIENDHSFLTDSNGLELIRRVRNHRDYPFIQTEDIAGNFFPVTTAIALQGKQKQITCFVDRAVAGSRVPDGSLQLMVHRATLVDDGRGVGEPLNETERVTPYVHCNWGVKCGAHTGKGLVVRGSVYLLVQSANNETWRQEADDKYFVPTPFSVSGNINEDNLPTFGHLQTFPKGLRLISLAPRVDGSVILRIAHEGSCHSYDSCQSSMIQLNVRNLIEQLGFDRPLKINRMTTTGNQLLVFSQDKYTTELNKEFDRPKQSTFGDDGVAQIFPMEIHTYVFYI